MKRRTLESRSSTHDRPPPDRPGRHHPAGGRHQQHRWHAPVRERIDIFQNSNYDGSSLDLPTGSAGARSQTTASASNTYAAVVPNHSEASICSGITAIQTRRPVSKAADHPRRVAPRRMATAAPSCRQVMTKKIAPNEKMSATLAMKDASAAAHISTHEWPASPRTVRRREAIIPSPRTAGAIINTTNTSSPSLMSSRTRYTPISNGRGECSGCG